MEGIIYEMSLEIHSPSPDLTVLKIADFPNVLKLMYFSGLPVQMEWMEIIELWGKAFILVHQEACNKNINTLIKMSCLFMPWVLDKGIAFSFF